MTNITPKVIMSINPIFVINEILTIKKQSKIKINPIKNFFISIILLFFT